MYKIADLKVNIPDLGNLKERCQSYLDESIFNDTADIEIDAEIIRHNMEQVVLKNSKAYLLSGTLFYQQLLKFDGMMLHASAVKYDGRVYLFSGPCGIGKTTHTKLWEKYFPGAVVINDDKPALRFIDGKWICYGTPWCGKDGINLNDSGELAGICFLKQGNINEIRKIEPNESVPQFIDQTVRSIGPKAMNRLLELLDELLKTIPVYELISVADRDAAELTREIMTVEN